MKEPMVVNGQLSRGTRSSWQVPANEANTAHEFTVTHSVVAFVQNDTKHIRLCF